MLEQSDRDRKRPTERCAAGYLLFDIITIMRSCYCGAISRTFMNRLPFFHNAARALDRDCGPARCAVDGLACPPAQDTERVTWPATCTVSSAPRASAEGRLTLDCFKRHELSVEMFMANTVRFQSWMPDEFFRQPEIGRGMLALIADGQEQDIFTARCAWTRWPRRISSAACCFVLPTRALSGASMCPAPPVPTCCSIYCGG